MKYSVSAIYSISRYVGDVEADSPEEAEEKGEDLAAKTEGNLCYACAGWLNGDLEISEVKVYEEVDDDCRRRDS